jgi:CMP-N-acetylneuraminic acid synthetase
MSRLGETLFIVQARLNSQRVPEKMLRPFAGTSLFSLVLDKLLTSSIIPKNQICASVYEKRLVEVAKAKGILVYERSEESANSDSSLQKIFEWHDKLPYKYVVIISGCNPLLKVETIDRFVTEFISQPEENLFAVIEKKQYYWNKEGRLITPWPEGQKILNTKAVEPTYEAAHMLYASRMDLIKEDKFMGDFYKPGGVKLFPVEELEAFDIDYQWQFDVAEKLFSIYGD